MWSHLSHELLCVLCVHLTKLIFNAFYELCWPIEPISQNWFEEENAGNLQIWLQSPYLAVFVSFKQPIDIHWSCYLGCIWWWLHRMFQLWTSSEKSRHSLRHSLRSLRQDMSWVEGVTLLSSEEHNVIALWRDSWAGSVGSRVNKNGGVICWNLQEKTDRNIRRYFSWDDIFVFLMRLFYV